MRSTAKAAQPELFHGALKEHGDKAGLWLSSYKAYMTASKEPDPLAYLPSYLRGEALRWWQNFGSDKLPAVPTMEHFSKVFLENYVKPSASITAREKLAVVKQGKYTVEQYVSYFKTVRSQIKVGTMIDSTPQAKWFVRGFDAKITDILKPTVSVVVINDIELIMAAALEAETKMSLTAKQDAIQHSKQDDAQHHGPVRTAAVRGGKGSARGGRNPYAKPRGGHNTGPGRGGFQQAPQPNYYDQEQYPQHFQGHPQQQRRFPPHQPQNNRGGGRGRGNSCSKRTRALALLP